MSDHTDTLTETERDSLTECECGHYLNEHSSDGCLATAYDGDDGMASLDDVCACMATPDLIRERAIGAIVAARVAAARAEAATVIEGFRKQNPMNGDGSNYTIDRILTALVGPDELARLKREHQDRWNTEYLDFLRRTGQGIEGADQ